MYAYMYLFMYIQYFQHRNFVNIACCSLLPLQSFAEYFAAISTSENNAEQLFRAKQKNT